jgi:hypothetical protein
MPDDDQSRAHEDFKAPRNKPDSVDVATGELNYEDPAIEWVNVLLDKPEEGKDRKDRINALLLPDMDAAVDLVLKPGGAIAARSENLVTIVQRITEGKIAIHHPKESSMSRDIESGQYYTMMLPAAPYYRDHPEMLSTPDVTPPDDEEGKRQFTKEQLKANIDTYGTTIGIITELSGLRKKLKTDWKTKLRGVVGASQGSSFEGMDEGAITEAYVTQLVEEFRAAKDQGVDLQKVFPQTKEITDAQVKFSNIAALAGIVKDRTEALPIARRLSRLSQPGQGTNALVLYDESVTQGAEVDYFGKGGYSVSANFEDELVIQPNVPGERYIKPTSVVGILPIGEETKKNLAKMHLK